MSEIITKLRLESNEYDSRLKNAVAQMGQMEKQVRRTGASFAYADKEELAFVRSLGQMGTQAQNAKGKLREYTDAITSLTATYRQLSAEEKSSDFGKAMAASIEELKAKAAELQDVMMDTSSEIKRLSSDTSTFDQLTGGIGACVAAFQVAQGAMQMFGVKNEEAMQAMAKLQAAMAVTNGLTKLQAALQKQSAVMIGIATLQKKASAAAEKMDTTAKSGNIVVTKAATVAQRALNAAAMANPYVLLAMAVVGVGAALYTFAKRSREASEEEKKAAQRTKEANERYEEYQKNVGETTGQLVAKYELLRQEWNSLSSAQEKNTWIEKNQSAFRDLGVEVTNLTDAENVFVRNTDKMLKAFELRAKAAALQKLSEKEYEAYYTAVQEEGGFRSAGDTRGETFGYNAYQRAMAADAPMKPTNPLDLVDSKDYYIDYGEAYNRRAAENQFALPTDEERMNAVVKYTEAGAKKYNDALMAEISGIKNGADSYIRQYQEVQAELNELMAGAGFKPAGGGDGTTPKPEDEIHPEGSIAALRKRIRDLQKEWELATTDEGRNEKAEEIQTLQAELDRLTGKARDAGNALKDAFAPGSLNDLQQQLREAKDKLYSLAPGTQEWTDALADVQTKQKAVNELQDQMKDKVDETSAAIKELPSAFEGFKEGVGAVSDIVSGLENMKNVGEELANVFKGEGDAIDGMFSIMKAGISTLQTVMTIYEALNTLMEIGTALKEAKMAADTAEATTAVTSATTEVAAEGEVAAASATTTGVKAGEAVAGAGEAMSGIPFVGPILAIAAIAAVLAAVLGAVKSAKSAKNSYATGGIVGGNSLSGDNVVAYLNSGEGVLTKQGIANAGEMLSQGGIGNLQLETKIHGNDLRCVLHNTDRSRGGGNRGAYAISKS